MIRISNYEWYEPKQNFYLSYEEELGLNAVFAKLEIIL